MESATTARTVPEPGDQVRTRHAAPEASERRYRARAV
jgi:hypothetical protein